MESVYSLAQMGFSTDQQKRVEVVLGAFESKAREYGNPEFFLCFNQENLNSLSVNQLMELQKFKNVLHHLEDIHVKTLRSLEYKNIEAYIKLIQEKIDYIKENNLWIEAELRRQYTDNIKENPLLEELFTYQQFKAYYSTMMAQDRVSVNIINQAKKDSNIYEIIRKEIVAALLLQENFDFNQRIHINELKTLPKIYNLFRAEILQDMVRSSLNLSVPFGRVAHTKVIRPSDAELSKKFNLDIHEALILTISLEEIGITDISEHDRVSYFDLYFESKGIQEVFNREFTFKINLNKKDYYITAPIHFSYIRCRLIDGQRSGGRK